MSNFDWKSLAGTSKPNQSPGFKLWNLANAWQREMRAALKPVGLTHVQYCVLAAIGFLTSEKDAPVSQSEIVRFLNIDKMMTSQVLATLVNSGQVNAEAIEGDRRMKSLTLTALGARNLTDAHRRVADADARYFGDNWREFTMFSH